LGLMGATRRLDHYDASTGWQPLFVVAAFGGLIIAAGIGLQILQVAHGIWYRKKNLDKTGDPWGGRTLEWSTTSPAPFYNFAVIPKVHERDEFWVQKQSKVAAEQPEYNDIHIPKNSGLGVCIAGASLVFGFAVVWHMWWLAAGALLAAVTLLIIRLTSQETEYIVTAEELAQFESKRRRYA